MLIFYCSTCNHYSGPPVSNGAGQGQGQGNRPRPLKPVRYHMWLKHLISHEHQAKTKQMLGRAYHRGPSKGSMLDDSTYIVVGLSKLRLLEFAVWCVEFGMLSELIIYPKLDCAAVTIQGCAVRPNGPGILKAQSFVEQKSCQQRLIRVFRTVHMTDYEWNLVREGHLKQELHQENLRLSRFSQHNDDGQAKRGTKTAAQNHHPAESDKENRSDNVDGPKRDQGGRVAKHGDRKANSHPVQLVCKLEEPMVEPTSIGSTGFKDGDLFNGPKIENERGSSVGGNQMRQRSCKPKRQRYSLANVKSGINPTISPLSITVNENRKVAVEIPKPDETEHSDTQITTAHEENTVNQLVERQETIVELTLEPIDRLVYVDVEKTDAEEVKVEDVESDAEKLRDHREEEKSYEPVGDDERHPEDEVVLAEEQKVNGELKIVHRKEERDLVEEEVSSEEKVNPQAWEEKSTVEVITVTRVDEHAKIEEKVCVEVKTVPEVDEQADIEEEKNSRCEKENTQSVEEKVNAMVKDIPHVDEQAEDEEKFSIKVIKGSPLDEQAEIEEENVCFEEKTNHREEEKVQVEEENVNAMVKAIPHVDDQAKVEEKFSIEVINGSQLDEQAEIEEEEEKAQVEEEKVNVEVKSIPQEDEKSNNEVSSEEIAVHCDEAKPQSEVSFEKKDEHRLKEKMGVEQGVEQEKINVELTPVPQVEEKEVEVGEKKVSAAEEEVNGKEFEPKLEVENVNNEEEKEVENEEEDYMQYAMYWYRF